MLDIEREMIKNMIQGMSLEEKMVVWSTLQDDQELQSAVGYTKDKEEE